MTYDWQGLELEYITGSVSLDELAGRDDSPALSSLERRSAKDGWVRKREAFRQQVQARVSNEAALEAAQLIAQQLRSGRFLHQTGHSYLAALEQNLRAAVKLNGKVDPAKVTVQVLQEHGLSVAQLLIMLKTGVELESAVLNRQEFVGQLVDGELERLLNIVSRRVDGETFDAILGDLALVD